MQGVFGRDVELARIEELIDAARAGAGAALLLLGDLGIGKSTLLEGAAARADGMRVLRARAVEAERELPFAGLAELLAPVEARIDALAPEYVSALAPVRGMAGADRAEPLAAAVALLRLLEAVAAHEPLVVLVDDAHWLDDASLDALCFAARRVGSERIAVVFAARAEPDRAWPARGIETLELHGVDEVAARRILGERLAPEPARTVLEAAHGNPLALIELARAGHGPGEPMRPSAAIERAFAAELQALPHDTRRALLVLAADERLTLERTHAVLVTLGLQSAALDAAERAGVLTDLRFRHPLLRSVVYHGAPLTDRVAVHLALAERAEGVARRAWHLAAAATGPDERAAAALEQAGEVAWTSGALPEAADAYERAVALTPRDADVRARRALTAARLLSSSGQPQRALAVAEDALADAPMDPAALAALQHVRGSITMRTGQLDAGALILTEHAERAAEVAPARAAQMLLDANLRHRIVGDYPAMIRVARRTQELAAAVDPPLAALGEMTEAIARINQGEGESADATIARHEALLFDPRTVRFGLEVLSAPAHASIWLERFARADRVLSTLIEAARERSAVTAVVYPLAVRAQLHLRRGRLRPALADGEEAVRLAFETRQYGLVGFATGMLAEVEAALGLEAACREHAGASIGVCDAIGGHAMGLWGRNALGLLELTLGRPEAAAPHLEACARLADRVGLVEPNTVQWAANLIEALVHVGRGDEARAHLPRLQRGAGTAWARAAALRSRGLLDADDDALEASIPAFETGDALFEAARSRLLLGERRRRSRRRRDSREPLSAALTAFEAGGATPWAERAAAELRAGGAASGLPPRARGELTPHELRVALLVAEGRTNPEVATQLFVTRKTVEHHLSQVYRKLGLRSRTELARRFADPSSGMSPMT